MGELEKYVGSKLVSEKTPYTLSLARKLSCMFIELNKNAFYMEKKNWPVTNHQTPFPTLKTQMVHPPPPQAAPFKIICFHTDNASKELCPQLLTIIVSCPSMFAKNHLHVNYFPACCAISVFKSFRFCCPLFHFQMSPHRTTFSTVCMSEENYKHPRLQ